jgi:cysteine-rich repeat protein
MGWARMRQTSWIAVLMPVLAAACDGGTAVDAGVDAGSASDCAGAEDGTSCGDDRICLADRCAQSVCGDGYPDPGVGEECDDQNDAAFDGCEPGTCEFTCHEGECDDQDPCDGEETCMTTSHVCVAGTPISDGTSCSTPALSEGVCRVARCVGLGCGNSVLDGSEECDDGNTTSLDGCESDCTFTCDADDASLCDDGDVCNGSEGCEIATHTCEPGTTLDCDDGSPCTADSCDDIEGCAHAFIDADGDGHAPIAEGSACGDDCDDSLASINPDEVELCGNGDDDDCDASTPDTAMTVFYPDCDSDGYAADGATGLPSCAEPTNAPCGSSGAWTTVPPTSARNTDCDDANAGRHPGLLDRCDDTADLDCDRARGTNVANGSRTYRFCADGVNPWGAHQSCADMGLRLAAVETLEENAFLTGAQPQQANWWIGLFLEGTQWTWWDWGSAVSYDNWDDAEPDAGEPCGGLRPWGLWFGLGCGTSARYGYICERP